ncbi:MAG: hypothetical protein IT329_09055 [Caldilineaceae bacterium]|nr:hypothetical protein [Caldilineaceae bacterium]
MLQQSSCPSCGAPVVFDATKPQIQCAYCRTPLVLLQRGNEVTLEALDKVKEAFDQSSRATQAAVAQSSRATQAAIFEAERATQHELKRMQLSNELASLRMQLSQVQSEGRALMRVPRKTRAMRHQQGDLHYAEVELADRIRAIERELGVARSDLSHSSARKGGCGRTLLGAFIWFMTFGLLASVLPEAASGVALVISIVATWFIMSKLP